jgi:hypothetical protein
MKLINFVYRYDFGHDWYAQFINIKNLSLLQISISWNDYPSWPYLQIKSGTGDVLDVMFWVYKFGIDVTIFGRTWNWDYMKDIKFDTSLDDCMPPWGHSDIEYLSRNKE